MHTGKIVHIVGCHAEGEVGDVIVGGVAPPPGDTIWEQSRWIARDRTLRNFLLNEPRGGVFRHFNLLVPPKNPKARMGWIIMEPEDTPPMSGSNSICVSTVLLETGIIEMQEPVTRMILEPPGGIIEVTAQCKDGKVTSVSIKNVASFVDKRDQMIDVKGIGSLCVDTAYGGDSFVIVSADQLGFDLVPDEARDLAETGIKITNAANEQLGFTHPENSEWDHISFCQITAPLEEKDGILTGKNTVAIQPGKLDRCPTGTGCSARMALLCEQGRLSAGDRYIAESIIGSRFHCRVDSATRVGDKAAIHPIISGQAWITGTYQHYLDPTDPWPQGYRIADTWPKY